MSLELIMRLKIYISLIVLALILIHSTQSSGFSKSSSESFTLYLSDNESLTLQPQNNQNSEYIRGSPGIILMYLVGTWSSEPLSGDLEIIGNVNFTLWARASGPLQLNCQFAIFIGKNDERGEQQIRSESKPLSGTPQPYTGNGDVSQKYNKGDRISIWIYAYERGQGGEILFGGDTPSSITFNGTSIYLSVTSTRKGSDYSITAFVYSIWGKYDWNLTLYVIGPLSKGDDPTVALKKNPEKIIEVVNEDEFDVITDEDWGGNYSYTWKVNPGTIESGTYYAILLLKTSSLEIQASTPIQVEVEERGIIISSEILSIFIISFMVIACLFSIAFYYKKKTGNYFGFIRYKKVTTALLLLIILGVVASGIIASLGTVTNRTTLENAPDFVITDINGKKLVLSEMRGNVVLLDMMATWCPTCEKIIPEIKKVYEKYPNLIIISVDVDASETTNDLRKFAEEHGITWHVAKDTDNLLKKYEVTEIPKIIIIDIDGKISYADVGYISSSKMGEEIEKAASGGGGGTGVFQWSMSWYLLVFLAGVSSFFAPCALPLLPAYMSYYIAVGKKEIGKKVILSGAKSGIASLFGILTIFTIIGGIVAFAGDAVKSYVGMISPAVAIIIIILGMILAFNYTWIFEKLTMKFQPYVSKIKMPLVKKSIEMNKGFMGLFSYGILYGGASLGCLAPIFIAIIFGGLMSGGFSSALLSFIVYALGMGSLMVTVTILLSMAKSKIVDKMIGAMPYINRLSGIVLVIVGIYLLYDFIVVA